MSGFFADREFDSAMLLTDTPGKIKNTDLADYFDLSTEIYFKWRATDVSISETNSYSIKPT